MAWSCWEANFALMREKPGWKWLPPRQAAEPVHEEKNTAQMTSNELLDPTRPEASCTLDWSELMKLVNLIFSSLKDACDATESMLQSFSAHFRRGMVIAHRKPLQLNGATCSLHVRGSNESNQHYPGLCGSSWENRCPWSILDTA